VNDEEVAIAIAASVIGFVAVVCISIAVGSLTIAGLGWLTLGLGILGVGGYILQQITKKLQEKQNKGQAQQ